MGLFKNLNNKKQRYMNNYSFSAAFNEMADQLEEMQKENPTYYGIISAKIRGHSFPITIAAAPPGGKLQKQFKATAAGLMILRRNYSELVPYWDIFTLSASIYTRYIED